jgi:DNA-binding LytR/AlgR family response regulator
MKVLVAEDDILIAEHLHDILMDCNISKVKLAHNYADISAQIQLFCPDLVLLDIHMDDKLTGIELAQELNQKYKIPFIFITAQSDKMVMDQAIETQPLGYIIKPFNSREIYATIQLAKQQTTKNYIFIKDIYGDVKLKLDEFIFAKADGNYIEIYTLDRKIVQRSTILAFINQLNREDFLQVHRSFIVNVNKIRRVEDYLYLEGDHIIPFSKKKISQLKDKLQF